MPSRSIHNAFNRLFFKFSGNDLHAYMDRAAKGLRTNHRNVGHDTKALGEMLINFGHKYTPKQITQTWFLHKYLDGLFSGLQEASRNISKKETFKRQHGIDLNKIKRTLNLIENLKKEILK